MEQALAEARKALAEGETPVGAVLMRGEEVLWVDHNRREQRHDPTAHAEMLCLRHGAERLGDWRLADCTLYVTLEPCPMCAGAMVMSRLGRCVYGAADPEKGCCGSIYAGGSGAAVGYSLECRETGRGMPGVVKGFFPTQTKAMIQSALCGSAA